MKAKKALLLSLFIWGGGQFFICKQRIKGLLLFTAQALLVGLELATGFWLEWMAGSVPNFSIRLHGGIFSRGIWGMITLGEVAGGKNGDNSVTLLINGIMICMLLLLFLLLYLWNLKDAVVCARAIQNGETLDHGRVYLRKLFHTKFPYFVLFPIAALFALVIIMPIIFTVLTAFLNYNRDHLPPGQLLSWVGFENFTKIFSLPIWTNTFTRVLLWTVVWAVSTTLFTFFLGLFQAIILNHPLVKGKAIFRTILILPWAVPQIISLLVFRTLLNGQFGPVNESLLRLGLIQEKIPFLTDPALSKITVICVFIWLGFPIFMVMMMGVLSNLDQSLYEAASIDGANRFHLFKSITLPLALKAVTPPLVMSFASNFNAFGPIYFLTKGGPVNPQMQFAGDTDILISWIYKLTLDQQMYNIAAVMSVLIFIVVGTFSYFNFKRTTSFKEM